MTAYISASNAKITWFIILKVDLNTLKMAVPKPTMEFYFNESRSATDTSDTFSVSSTPKPHMDHRGSLYKSKYDSMSPYGLAGRASPGHDLGYHTLLTRDSVTPTPTHTPTIPRRTLDMLSCSSSSFRWSDVPSPICNTSPYPRSAGMMTPPPRNHTASSSTSTGTTSRWVLNFLSCGSHDD